MISKGTHKPLVTDTADKEGCVVGWCYIPSWTRGALSSFKVSGRSKQEHHHHHHHDDGSRKRQRRSHHSNNNDGDDNSNKLERLLFDEIRQCDVCGENLLCSTSKEESVAEALPKFIERHITCQSPFPCRWCDDKTKKYCCDSLFCSDNCRTQAECALSDDASIPIQARNKQLLMPPPKLFFCQNRFQWKGSNTNNDNAADDLNEEAVQSLAVIEAKFRIMCGNNLGLEECALLITTILSIVSPCWVDNFLQSIGGDAYQDGGSDYEESLTEELWAMARSHWSVVVLSNERNDDDDASNRRQFMSYQLFCQTYLCIKRQCISRVSLPEHPLIIYSKKTLMSSDALSDIERDLALDILEHPCLPINRHTQSKSNDADDRSIIRWRNAAHIAHWLSNAASLEEGNGLVQIQSHLGQNYFVFSPWAYRKMQHSCCPLAMLDIQDPCSPLESLSWLALHDVEEGLHLNSFSALGYLEGDTRSRAIELQKLFGSDFTCSCIRCKYENNITGNKGSTLRFNKLQQLKSLADLAMQQTRYEDAFGLYELILQSLPSDGNVLHARAAAALGTASTSFGDRGHCNGYFIRAQRLWEEAGSIGECLDHPDISLHLTKQRVYGTMDSLDENHKIEIDGTNSNIQYSTYLNGKCFVTSMATPLLSEDECKFIIKTAKEHCNSTNGWTTTRHYAVPTTDIPIHEMKKLHPLFTKKLWSGKIRPLLQNQFKLNANHRIFINDAFVVRYDSSKQRHLPPHIDESSHSFIIALNSEFKGGGTFIHELGHVISPTIGGMVSFEGGALLHSGDPVISGIRYCIVAFCYIDEVVGEQAAAKTTASFSFGFQFG